MTNTRRKSKVYSNVIWFKPVGNGYIDLIVTRGRAVQLIDELAQLPIIVSDLSWWCLCTVESQAKLAALMEWVDHSIDLERLVQRMCWLPVLRDNEAWDSI